jgi:hypothetical protein
MDKGEWIIDNEGKGECRGLAGAHSCDPVGRNVSVKSRLCNCKVLV